MSQKNIIAKIDHNIRSDPNANCDILFAELANAKQLHMPTERVKFNKKNHKVQPGMNNVLLKKIIKKSDKYSKLLKIPKTDENYAFKKTEFNEYVKSVKNDIRIAKRNYYFHVFNIHRNNIKQTWNTISETLNRHRKNRDIPEKIIYNDKTLINEQDIADSFNSFLQMLVLSSHLLLNNLIAYPHSKLICIAIPVQIQISILHQWTKI